jgi:hypothetical protein
MTTPPPPSQNIVTQTSETAYSVETRDLHARIAELVAKLAEAEESAAYLEQRRGGECDKCGSWVCPPLRCVGCMMKSRITPASDPTQLAADTVPILTRRAESAESQLAAEREAVRVFEDALRRIVDGCPACTPGGGMHVEHFDENGEHVGTQDVDPVEVVASMFGIASAAIQSARKETP